MTLAQRVPSEPAMTTFRQGASSMFYVVYLGINIGNAEGVLTMKTVHNPLTLQEGLDPEYHYVPRKADAGELASLVAVKDSHGLRAVALLACCSVLCVLTSQYAHLQDSFMKLIVLREFSKCGSRHEEAVDLHWP